MRFRIKKLWTILLTTQLWPLIVMGIEVHEPQTENTTENDDISILPTTESVTFPPTDNGMTVPEQIVSEGIPTSSDHSIFDFKEEEKFPKPTVSSSILFDYHGNLGNHKNFTPSPYLGTLETPPILDQYNRLRQQYKEYYEQKSQYNQKPIKFEENAAKNHYVTNNFNSYLEPNHAKKVVEQLRYKHKPFPYAYEHEKNLQNNFEQTSFGTAHVDAYSGVDNQFSDGHQNDEHNEEHHEVVASHKIPLAGLKDHIPLAGLKDHIPGFEHHIISHGNHLPAEHKDKSGSTWKKILRMLTALVPLGFFIATLTPNILQINTTVSQKPSRQRSLDELGIEFTEEDLKDPLVQLVQQYGLDSLDDPQCEDKMFCEMSRMGQNDSSNIIQKGFWYLANETPDDLANKVGMKELFQAIRAGTCDAYKCTPKKKPEEIIAKPEKKIKTEIKYTRKKKIAKENRM